MNLFVSVSDQDKAAKSNVDALRKEGMLEGVINAATVYDESGEEIGDKVVWPPNHKEDFSVLGNQKNKPDIY